MSTTSEKSKKILLEVVWWVFTILVAVAVLFPIYINTTDYPFYLINFIYIVAFITITRYIFLHKHTFIARMEAVKVILVFLCIPLVFYLVQELNFFQTFVDENGWESVVGEVDYKDLKGISQYIRSEMLLFGTASIIAAVLFPFRMVLSVWRQRNRGTV